MFFLDLIQHLFPNLNIYLFPVHKHKDYQAKFDPSKQEFSLIFGIT